MNKRISSSQYLFVLEFGTKVILFREMQEKNDIFLALNAISGIN